MYMEGTNDDGSVRVFPLRGRKTPEHHHSEWRIATDGWRMHGMRIIAVLIPLVLWAMKSRCESGLIGTGRG